MWWYFTLLPQIALVSLSRWNSCYLVDLTMSADCLSICIADPHYIWYLPRRNCYLPQKYLLAVIISMMEPKAADCLHSWSSLYMVLTLRNPYLPQKYFSFRQVDSAKLVPSKSVPPSQFRHWHPHLPQKYFRKMGSAGRSSQLSSTRS